MDTINVVVFIIVIIALISVIYYCYRKKQTKEGFWGIPARTVKVERVLRDDCSSPSFFQTPNYQALLSPRFSNVNYGPYLQTKLPEYDMMAVTADPLGGENGGSFCASDSCKPLHAAQRIVNAPCDVSAYANGNYKQVLKDIVEPFNGDDDASVEQNEGLLTHTGELRQPIVYDRYMYANRKSRLRSLGDPFRGDLPIIPASGNWFVPSVHPNIDLNPGVLNAIGGVNNETNNQLANLIYASSGGTDTAIGGVDMSGHSALVSTANFGSDVIATSFP